ncbi:MAG: dienelactone hydrolase family protein [Polaromonas sp.]|nr:dienelactone hydrolase family protein [Polaromonas sp.]
MSPDLTFPTEAKELSMFSPHGMAIFKPAGAGPFPAVVLHHSCGGIRTEIREWAKLALERGYVVFVLDSLGPRGLKTNCFPPTPVPTSRGTKDAFQALKHLKTFPFVDSSRVGLVGFSWGAMVGLMASSNEVASVLSQGERFAAAVSFYPMCYFGGNPQNPATVEYLRADTDRPLLVLMGDQDNETPPADCLPRLEALNKQGAPVEWHLYASATHCWDCSSRHNFRKTDFQGNSVVYHYSKEITADSARRTFDFLAKRMEPRK